MYRSCKSLQVTLGWLTQCVKQAQEVCCALLCVRTIWKAKKSSQFRHISLKITQKSLVKNRVSYSRTKRFHVFRMSQARFPVVYLLHHDLHHSLSGHWTCCRTLCSWWQLNDGLQQFEYPFIWCSSLVFWASCSHEETPAASSLN